MIPTLLFLFLAGGLWRWPLPWSSSWAWIPTLDIEFAFYVDGLAAQFLLLITGVGSLVMVYGAGYLRGVARRLRVFLLLLLFMFAMIGAVASDHLLVLFLFWELTSVLSFLLVGFDHAQESSRKSAQQAILVTGAGGLCLLAGIILLGQIADTYSLHKLIAAAPLFTADARLIPALLLLILGAATKSAQFPFHFWLPNAMAAPTPVSAYLHSATMVKLGIYLLARLDAAFSEVLFWEYSLIGVGTLTAVFAAVQTVYERDLKRILAWSTVATLGTLVMLVGLPGKGAALALVTLFFAHALYKAPLFFVAGNLDHGAGTRQIDQLTGMRHYMPWTAAVAMLAALSMAGLPLTFGFVAKDALTLAKAEAGGLQLITYATVFVNAVSVAVAAIAAVHIFWGRDTVPRQVHPHEAGPSMLLPPLVLVSVGLLFGLRPELVDPLLGAAARSVAPGFDPATVGTAYDVAVVFEALLVALVLGLAVYLRWNWLHRQLGRFAPLERYGPEAWYRNLLGLIPSVSARVTRFFQHGSLPGYLLILIGTVPALVLVLTGISRPDWSLAPSLPLTVPVVGAAGLIVLGAVATLVVREHLTLLLVAGLVGYGSAVLFLFTGAPDVALTQFAVETVFVVVVASVLVRLRGRPCRVPAEPRWRPLALAVASLLSLTLGGLLLLSAAGPFDPSLSAYFGSQSLPAAHGRNVVNVILVDFRALDTLGEICVLVFALLAAWPLFRSLREGRL